MIKIIGIEKSVGEFTPPNSTTKLVYNNYNFYGIELDDKTGVIVGNKAKKIKVKIEDFDRIMQGKNVESLYDHVVEFYYNEYGKLFKIVIIK